MQDAYMARILKSFKLIRINPKVTLMATGLQLRKHHLDDLIDEAYKKWYLEAIKSFIWLLCQIKLDLLIAIGKLLQYLANPLNKHQAHVKRVFRYI